MPIAQGLIDQDFRFNPVTRNFLPEDVTTEIKTCTQLNGLGVYGFFLNEIPMKESPSSVVVTRQSDNVIFSEVNVMPVGTQFYVDYHYPDKSNRGIIVLPSSQNGQNFIVSYKALGSALHKNNINALMQQNLAPINTQITNINNTLNDWGPKVYALADLGIHSIATSISNAINNVINFDNRKILYLVIDGSIDLAPFGISQPIGNDFDVRTRIPINININNTAPDNIHHLIIRFNNVTLQNTTFALNFRFHPRVWKNNSLLSNQTYNIHPVDDSLFTCNMPTVSSISNIYYTYSAVIVGYTYCTYKAFQSNVNANLQTGMRF